MSIKHISRAVFVVGEGTHYEYICGFKGSYGYVSDEVFKTWEECPVCYEELGKTLHTTTHPPAGEPVVEEVIEKIYLRDALDG